MSLIRPVEETIITKSLYQLPICAALGIYILFYFIYSQCIVNCHLNLTLNCNWNCFVCVCQTIWHCDRKQFRA